MLSESELLEYVKLNTIFDDENCEIHSSRCSRIWRLVKQEDRAHVGQNWVAYVMYMTWVGSKVEVQLAKLGDDCVYSNTIKSVDAFSFNRYQEFDSFVGPTD